MQPYSHAIQGHLWGADVSDLLATLPAGEKFDIIFLSDLGELTLLEWAAGSGKVGGWTSDNSMLTGIVFNHGQHEKLLQSCNACLRDDGLGVVRALHSYCL